jgi:hypothetical protein
MFQITVLQHSMQQVYQGNITRLLLRVSNMMVAHSMPENDRILDVILRFFSTWRTADVEIQSDVGILTLT